MNASPIRCLVTAGPTREFFDPVRFVSNPSSGKMGYALAAAAVRRNWEVELVSGPVSLEAPEGVALERVVTGAQMFDAVSRRFPACDILIMTAAVIDYRPKRIADHKIKKFELEMVVEMEPVVDILATVAAGKTRQVVVGFAAETDHIEAYAARKLADKNADFIVANRIGQNEGAFGSEINTVTVLSRSDEPLQLGPEAKSLLAERLLDIFTPCIRKRKEVS